MYIFLFFYHHLAFLIFTSLLYVVFFGMKFSECVKAAGFRYGREISINYWTELCNFQCSHIIHNGIYCNDKQVSVSHHQILLPIMRLAIIFLDLSPYHCHQNSGNVRISSSIDFCRTSKSISTHIISLLTSSLRFTQLRQYYGHSTTRNCITTLYYFW